MSVQVEERTVRSIPAKRNGMYIDRRIARQVEIVQVVRSWATELRGMTDDGLLQCHICSLCSTDYISRTLHP